MHGAEIPPHTSSAVLGKLTKPLWASFFSSVEITVTTPKVVTILNDSIFVKRLEECLHILSVLIKICNENKCNSVNPGIVFCPGTGN